MLSCTVCRFDALVKDLFPTANTKEIEYLELSKALDEVYKDMKLVAMPSQVCDAETPRVCGHLCIWSQSVIIILERISLYVALNTCLHLGVLELDPQDS